MAEGLADEVVVAVILEDEVELVRLESRGRCFLGFGVVEEEVEQVEHGGLSPFVDTHSCTLG